MGWGHGVAVGEKAGIIAETGFRLPMGVEGIK